MIIDDAGLQSVSPAVFADGTGWDPKPQGLCRGEVCVPAPAAIRDDGTVDVAIAAERPGMRCSTTISTASRSVGPGSTTGHALSTVAAADPQFVDRDGNPFRLSSLRGRKVILHAWASYCGCRDGIASWQALHEELEPLNVSVVSVALDVEPEHTYKWIDQANPTHPCVIDTRHATAELFGINNIPMAVWIDEDGTIVRNAESAAIVRSPFRDIDVPDGLPERLARLLTEAKAIPDDSEAYRARRRRLGPQGRRLRVRVSPDEVVERSRPRGRDEATAAAAFELGQYLRAAVDDDAAVPWWRMAHELDPGNWTYKRQAWTLVTTAAGGGQRPAPAAERRVRRQLARRRRRCRWRRPVHQPSATLRDDAAAFTPATAAGPCWSVSFVVMEHVRLLADRTLHNPVMLFAFTGWNDAGEGASAAVRTMVNHWGATHIADIDPEVFTDFATVRPSVYPPRRAPRHRLADGTGLGRLAARRRRDPDRRPGTGAAVAPLLTADRRTRRALQRVAEHQPRRTAPPTFHTRIRCT